MQSPQEAWFRDEEMGHGVSLSGTEVSELLWVSLERGSVVRSRTGSRGTHWSRRKASQPSCLTKALSSWGGGVRLGKVKLLCRVKSWNTRGGRGGSAPGDKLGFERRQGAILLPFSSCGGSPYKKAFLK